MAWSAGVAAAERDRGAALAAHGFFGRRRCRFIDDVLLNDLVARRVRADGARGHDLRGQFSR